MAPMLAVDPPKTTPDKLGSAEMVLVPTTVIMLADVVVGVELEVGIVAKISPFEDGEIGSEDSVLTLLDSCVVVVVRSAAMGELLLAATATAVVDVGVIMDEVLDA
jgi:hypothetical protein